MVDLVCCAVPIANLVLEHAGFLRCVLHPGESLHVFSTVLTRLQVRLDDALSDAVWKNMWFSHLVLFIALGDFLLRNLWITVSYKHYCLHRVIFVTNSPRPATLDDRSLTVGPCLQITITLPTSFKVPLQFTIASIHRFISCSFCTFDLPFGPPNTFALF